MRTLLPFLLLTACSGDKDSAAPNDTATEPMDAPFTPDLATAQCGMPAYDWRSTAEPQLGQWGVPTRAKRSRR